MTKSIKYLSLLFAIAGAGLIGTGPASLAQTGGQTPMPKVSNSAQENMSKPDGPDGVYSEIATDHAIGSVDAPSTMIVFASVTCPHCASWFETDYPKIKTQLVDTGKLRLVFREFPTQPVQVAVAGFLIASCGSEADYFDHIEYQMAEQKNTILNLKAGKVKETFDSLGAKAGLSSEEVAACLSDKSGFDALNANVARARAAGLNSVPAIMLNGVLQTAEQAQYDTLSTAITAFAE